jgi:hypothetical protein
VIAYLEDRLKSETATQKETEVYENYVWSGTLDKTNYSLKTIIKRMNKQYNG